MQHRQLVNRDASYASLGSRHKDRGSVASPTSSVPYPRAAASSKRLRLGKGTVPNPESASVADGAAAHKAALNERVYADLLRNPAAIAPQ
jgi:hypothetical protein